MAMFRNGLLLAAGLCLSLTALTGAQAREGFDRGTGTVTAQSQFGQGTVTGPVRIGRFGREVRLPGGTWEACRRSCSETLRVETVDFWYAHGPSAITNECGIFGCLTLGYPR